jgi:hypothetical protein
MYNDIHCSGEVLMLFRRKLDGKLAAECVPLFAEWVSEIRSNIATRRNNGYRWW